jgi:hypothetical protein
LAAAVAAITNLFERRLEVCTQKNGMVRVKVELQKLLSLEILET